MSPSGATSRGSPDAAPPRRARAAASPAADEGDCLYGVVREIVNSDAAPERGARFCEQVPSATAPAASPASARCCPRSSPARQAARRVPQAQRPPRALLRGGRRARGLLGVSPTMAGVSNLQQETTALLQRLIRSNTVNPPGDERAAQEMLAAELRERRLRGRAAGRRARAPEPRRAAARRRRRPDAVPAVARRHRARDARRLDARPVVGRPRRRLRVGTRRAGHEVPDRGRGRRGAVARARGLAAGARRPARRRRRRRGGRRRARRDVDLRAPSRRRCAATTCSTRAAARSSPTTAGASTASASPRRASFASA